MVCSRQMKGPPCSTLAPTGDLSSAEGVPLNTDVGLPRSIFALAQARDGRSPQRLLLNGIDALTGA